MVELEKVSYKNFTDCLRLTNGRLEVIVSVNLGPRILVCRRMEADAVNFMKNFDDQIAAVVPDQWQSYGGHRLWHAPETWERTYYPDNTPVDYQWDGKVLHMVCQPETTTGLQKEIDLLLSEEGTHVLLRQRIFNRNLWPVRFAPWGLTVMAAGGRLIVPQEPYVPHGHEEGESFDYARPLVLWKFTKMNDPRFQWGEFFIQMRQDDTQESKLKFGVADKPGWAAYELNGELFVKSFDYRENASYPDGGCNAEFFTMPGFLEIEALGTHEQIAPGECANLDEEWDLPGKVALPQDETAMKTVLESVVTAR
ncbi:MAG: hypothetical protein PHS41_06380 [Victivallaceae bacterium]|nr:hypothetical protein [Victivallaceae bacterium]